jgi:hypothetical protein
MMTSTLPMVMTSGFQETKSAGEYNIVKDKTEYDLVYNHRELLLMACLSLIIFFSFFQVYSSCELYHILQNAQIATMDLIV